MMHGAPQHAQPLGPPRPPALRAALALLLAGLLSGCGDDPPKAPVALVEVVTNRLDGDPPTHGLTVRRLGRTSLGPPIALQAVAGTPHLYEAPGAEEGSYLLGLPDGWGPLYVVNAPHVQLDGRPTRMNAGRPHTIYLTARTGDQPLGEEWAVRRVEASGTLGARLEVRVEIDGNGWVLLRVKPPEWAGPIALQGRFADRSLTELVLTTLKEAGLPILRQLEPEPVAPLRVTVVGAAGERWVHARVLGLPLDEVQQQPVRDGAALFSRLATSREGLEVRLGEGPDAPAFRLAPQAWARDGELRLHDLPPAPRFPVRLPLPPGAEVLRVQLRAEGEDSYGWVPLHVEAGALVLGVGVGAWRVLLETAGGCATGSFRVREDGAPEGLTISPLEPMAVVQGAVAGGAGGVRLRWERLEGERAVLGHGFVVAAGQAGAFEATLPSGEYQLVLEGPEGARSKPVRYRLEPGQRVSVALDAPEKPPEKPPGGAGR